MSVASRTKTKRFITVVLGFLAALVVLPTWANTSQGYSALSTVRPIVTSTSSQSNQDLSELRRRLQERFSWIASEVTSLFNWTASLSGASLIAWAKDTSVSTVDVSQWYSHGVAANKDFFSDISNDPYRTYINRLAAYGALAFSEKYFPQNYFRTNDFLSLIAKLSGSLPDEAKTILSWSTFMTKSLLQQIMYILPNVQKIDIDGNPYDKLFRSEWAYYLVRMFDLPTLDSNKDSVISLSDAFSDIIDTPFREDINILASLDIVNRQSGKFYPDNYVRHYDFVIIFINALLASQHQALASSSSLSPFADVDASASYLPQLIYAADRGLIDYLIASRGWQLFFDPDMFVTKDQVYHTLSKPTDVTFTHIGQYADQEKISRAELAKLLVDTFWFKAAPASQSFSWSLSSTGEMSMLMKLKTLLSML